MKKFIIVSTLALSLISAANAAPILKDGNEILSKHPINIENRSKEYGGTKDAVDAYSDGVGVYVGAVKPDNRINQSPMAELVEKYGESAKAKGITVAEEVAFGSVATEADKALLAKVIDKNSIIPDETPCDDGNIQTINDKYTSGVCKGITPPVAVTYEPFTGLYYTAEQPYMTYPLAVSRCESFGMRLPHLSETVANPEHIKKGIPSALPLQTKMFFVQTTITKPTDMLTCINYWFTYSCPQSTPQSFRCVTR